MARSFIRRQGKQGARKFQKKTQTDREAKRQKWLHHCLKALQKELKKAKEFEIRKLLRRIHGAKEAADKQTGTSKHQQQLDVSKLAAQLEAAKALQLEPLAKQVAASAGLLQPVDGHAEEQQPEQALALDVLAATDELQESPQQQQQQQQQQDVSTPQGMLMRRVSNAGCVRKQVEAFQQQYRKLFGQKQTQREAASAQPGVLQEGHEEAVNQGDGEGGRGSSSSGAEEGLGGSDIEADQMESKARKQQSPRFVHPLLAAASSDDDDNEHGRGGQEGGMEPQRGSTDDDADGRGDDMSEGVSSEEGVLAEQGGEEGSEDEGSFNSEDYDMDMRQSDDSDVEQPQQADPTKKSSASALTRLQATKPAIKSEQQGRLQATSQGDKAHAKADVSRKVLKAAAKKDKQDMLRNDPLLQPRKNRVGQRARRAHYEKMYGTRANHLAKQKQPIRSRGGPDLADNANRGQPDKKRAGMQAAAGEQLVKKARLSSGSGEPGDQAAEEKLHPSWAARKAAKQKLAISAAAPMQPARKVVFDDTGEVAKVVITGNPQQQQQSARQADGAGSTGRGGHGSGWGRGRGRGRSVAASRPGEGRERGAGRGRGGRGGHVSERGGHRGGFTASSRSNGREHLEHAQRGDASKAADPHLHPSWAAKQQMKQKQQALVPAEGKKIVFDD